MPGLLCREDVLNLGFHVQDGSRTVIKGWTLRSCAADDSPPFPPPMLCSFLLSLTPQFTLFQHFQEKPLPAPFVNVLSCFLERQKSSLGLSASVTPLSQSQASALCHPAVRMLDINISFIAGIPSPPQPSFQKGISEPSSDMSLLL